MSITLNFGIRSIIFLLLISLSCNSPRRCPLTTSTNYFQNEVPSRTVSANQLTPKNIALDTSGLNINTKRIDRLVDETEACLARTFPGGILPDSVVKQAACKSNRFNPIVPRECITVKIISDWTLSTVSFAGSKHQLIPGVIAEGCTEKGMSPGACYKRVGILDNTTIVVPPSMYVFKEPIVKITTGCYQPWSSPALSACMTPTTGALDDGTGP